MKYSKILDIYLLLIILIIISCSKNNDEINIEKPLFDSKNRIDALDSLNLTIKDIEIYNNNIYILDQMNYRVCVLDSNYKLIKTIGRKGNGPGEFYFYPADIKIFLDKIYVLIDRQLNIFDIKGNFVKRIMVDASMSNIEINDQDSTILISTPISLNDKQEDIHLYTVLDKNCENLEKVTIKSKYLSKAKASLYTQTLIKRNGDKLIVNETKDDIFHIFDLENNYIKTVKGDNTYLKNKRVNSPNEPWVYTNFEMIELNNNNFGIMVINLHPKYYSHIDLYDSNYNYKGKIVFLEKQNDKMGFPSLKLIGDDAYVMSGFLGNKDLYKIPNFKQKIENLLKEKI